MPAQKDLKAFTNQLRAAGGPYKAFVERLLDSSVNEQVCCRLFLVFPHTTKTQPELQTLYTLTDYSTADHQQMYQDAKNDVRNGKLPVRKELAIMLAAIHIHIEDLERLRTYVTVARPLPNVKVKGYLPVDFKVC
jgi:hypothetical protein